MIPKENEKDIQEIPASVREGLEIITIEHADQALREALLVEDQENYNELLQERDTRYLTLFGPAKKEGVVVPDGEKADGEDSVLPH